ncbi:MAG TPA: DUF4912 domain-containing protein [Desulfotomaculum sp.]|nr:DUF4912 domain-containing protein [Desulfotomaculum sp.]
MTAFLPWFFGFLIIFLFAGAFLLLKKRQANFTLRPLRPSPQKMPLAKLDSPLFKEEYAGDLTIPSEVMPQPQEPEEELPGKYNIDRLVLMARDPHWLYAYWEISATTQEEFKTNYGPFAWGQSQPVLRIYDVTGTDFEKQSTFEYTDILISDQADDWYIQVGQPDRSFCIEVGRKFQNGHFITLLRSNVVSTPRASLSEQADEEWMWIENLYQTIKYQYGISSPLIVEEIAGRAGIVPLGISSPGFYVSQT